MSSISCIPQRFAEAVMGTLVRNQGHRCEHASGKIPRFKLESNGLHEILSDSLSVNGS
jgi:hypothetical protein